jgi:hypothetical protein
MACGHSPTLKSSVPSAACPAGRARATPSRAPFSSPPSPDGIDFLRRVAEVAEAQAHHPDVDVRYTKLVFHLSTHDAGGITTRDLALASAVDALYEGITPIA